MNKVIEEKLNILKEFTEICHENELWYSMDNHSLLALYSEENIIEELDHFDVMMTVEAYEKLKNKYPTRVLDSCKHSEYFMLQNKFVIDYEDIYKEQPFININLIMPTKTKRVKNYIKIKNRYLSFVNFYSTFNHSNISKIQNKINIAKLLKPVTKLITYKDIVNVLYDDAYEGFIVTEALIKKSSLNKWISNLSFRTHKEKINDIEVASINEYDNYLNNIYGKDYKNIKTLSDGSMHTNPVDLQKFVAMDVIEEFEASEQ
ncbi:hypothetical protein [Metamycoplasma neophronis]|uniref:LicD family protein n=1 Tax=Metamycoplasma neophronis TaxID=872983 RepID=A0ABY2Z4R7_9BACT|nr:hypothetical protein [Metamycoplasma neophronis]TPR54676.1 hypothetical protein FJR74_00170 [Metamycoplasma neophronis]